MTRLRGAVAIGPALIASVVGCSRRPTETDAGPASAPIAAEVSGCEAWAEPSVCEVVDGQELRIVVQGTTTPTVRLDDAVAPPVSIVDVDGGKRIAIRVPGHARTLVLGDRAFTLRLAPSTTPEWVRAANALRRTGKIDEAQAIAAAHLGDAGVDGARARALPERDERGDTVQTVNLGGLTLLSSQDGVESASGNVLRGSPRGNQFMRISLATYAPSALDGPVLVTAPPLTDDELL